MPLHLKAWRAALELHGFPGENFTLAMHHAYAGMPGPAIVRDLNEKFGTHLDPEATERDKVAWYLDHHGEAQPVQAVADFAIANAQAAAPIPMAVASGSDRRLVIASLAGLGLLELFPVVITPELVAPGRGKPAPDMFVLAAQELGVDPTQCLVFEDGHLGMQAAAAAGMAAVWVDMERNDRTA
jgi:HAD superfamily hydrolase (TIGR01509 family)